MLDLLKTIKDFRCKFCKTQCNKIFVEYAKNTSEHRFQITDASLEIKSNIVIIKNHSTNECMKIKNNNITFNNLISYKRAYFTLKFSCSNNTKEIRYTNSIKIIYNIVKNKIVDIKNDVESFNLNKNKNHYDFYLVHDLIYLGENFSLTRSRINKSVEDKLIKLGTNNLNEFLELYLKYKILE